MCVCKSTNTDVKNNIVQSTWCYLIIVLYYLITIWYKMLVYLYLRQLIFDPPVDIGIIQQSCAGFIFFKSV